MLLFITKKMQEDIHSQLIEIYRTECGAVYQCNKNNFFILEFGGRVSTFKTSNFLDFIRLVKNINLTEMARNMSRHADIAILMPHYTERCFVLTMNDAICLKELLGAAKTMIHLNSMVNECLQPYAF